MKSVPSTGQEVGSASSRVPDGLDTIFRPKSIAVLGVTNTPGTVPHDIFVNLLDSRVNGVVYPVAPRKLHIAGVRAYDYVLDIPDPVDLAVLVFPGAVCEKALTQCVEKGVKSAIIISIWATRRRFSSTWKRFRRRTVSRDFMGPLTPAQPVLRPRTPLTRCQHLRARPGSPRAGDNHDRSRLTLPYLAAGKPRSAG